MIGGSVLEEGDLGIGQGQVLDVGALGRGQGASLWRGSEERIQKLPWLGSGELNIGHLRTLVAQVAQHLARNRPDQFLNISAP